MARDGGTPGLGMMMLRYDDDGGGALSLSSLSLPSSLDESSSQGWIRCRQICFFAALEFGVYDFLFVADLSLTPVGEACMHDWLHA